MCERGRCSSRDPSERVTDILIIVEVFCKEGERESCGTKQRECEPARLLFPIDHSKTGSMRCRTVLVSTLILVCRHPSGNEQLPSRRQASCRRFMPRTGDCIGADRVHTVGGGGLLQRKVLSTCQRLLVGLKRLAKLSAGLYAMCYVLLHRQQSSTGREKGKETGEKSTSSGIRHSQHIANRRQMEEHSGNDERCCSQ